MVDHPGTEDRSKLLDRRAQFRTHLGTLRVPSGLSVAHGEVEIWSTTQMRTQYNFWPGEIGLDAWAVDRLIELSRDLPVKHVPLDSIWQLDTPFWSQPLTVRQVAAHMRLVQRVDLSYPIILAADGRVHGRDAPRGAGTPRRAADDRGGPVPGAAGTRLPELPAG